MRPRWKRQEPKPAQVAALEASVGRALAWGLTDQGAAVVATDQALVLDGAAATTVPWHCIDQASWESPLFTIRYRDPSTGRSHRLHLELAEPGELPPAVRERVTGSVLVSRRVSLAGDRGAVLAARRDAAGVVRWTIVFDPGLDPADPHLQRLARDALAELRQSLGA